VQGAGVVSGAAGSAVVSSGQLKKQTSTASAEQVPEYVPGALLAAPQVMV
jgi:hypothetical protein